MVYLITGKARAGKTTYATRLTEELSASGHQVLHLDGDNFRRERDNQDFTDEGRLRNLMEAANVARRAEADGQTVVMSFIAPRREWRDAMRKLWKISRVIYIPGGSLWDGTTYESPTDDELTTVHLFMAKSDKWILVGKENAATRLKTRLNQRINERY